MEKKDLTNQQILAAYNEGKTKEDIQEWMNAPAGEPQKACQLEPFVINFLRKKTPVFKLIRNRIINYCLKTYPDNLEHQIYYLRYCLYRYRNYRDELDQNYGLEPAFDVFIQEEIKFREFLINMLEQEKIAKNL